jgi:2-succinyl-6-hydroxy-2,4-cyclohexadiene-1-carboxylate synthase
VRVVLVHGFTQTRRSWDDVAEALAGAGSDLDVAMVELPGHGEAAGLRLGFVETAAYLGDTGGPATYVGYSMGGRLCLRLAVDQPDLVHSLVLVGASPGIADADARDARRRSDALLASDLEHGDVGAFLEQWLAQPLFETSTPRPHDLEARRANPREGLAYALRTLGTGSQEPLWDRLADLEMPTVLVAGADDAKFRAIADEMAGAIGTHARTVVVEGAGHAVPLDQPEALADIVAHAASTA